MSIIKSDPLITDLINEKTTKLDNRIIFFGAADELSCHIMEIRCLIDNVKIQDALEQIVRNLSKIMGEVAGSKNHLEETSLQELLNLIRDYQENNGLLNSFILPGSTIIASRIHITRCIARRTELSYAKVYDEFGGSDIIFEYLNKLSTLFYALALKYESPKLIKKI